MTHETARQLVRQMVETGRLLETIRWREVASLDEERARRASDALIESALTVPLPTVRRATSGLVHQQAIFQRVRP